MKLENIVFGVMFVGFVFTVFAMSTAMMCAADKIDGSNTGSCRMLDVITFN